MHRFPYRAGLDFLIKHKHTQSLHIIIRLAVGSSLFHLVNHAAGASDSCFDHLFISVFLAFDTQVGIDDGGTEPEVRVVLRRGGLVQCHARHIFKQFTIQSLHMFMMFNMFVGHKHLSASDAGADITHAVVISYGSMLIIRISVTGLGSIPHDVIFAFDVVANQGAASRSSYHLVPVEAQHSEFSERAKDTSVPAGAEAFSSVFDDGNLVFLSNFHDTGAVVRHSIKCDGDDSLGFASRLGDTVFYCFFKQDRVHIPRVRLRVNKNRLCAKISDWV